MLDGSKAAYRRRCLEGAIVLAAALLLYVCSGADGRMNGGRAASEPSGKDEDKRTYTFVDVEGAVYEADYLEGLPGCSYEYERLKEKEGYKYYTGKDGTVVSRAGIDVSEYQQSVDWAQVRESGIEFAMIRVGYRGYGSSGKLVEDKLFRAHMDGALGAGLEVGVYFFSQAVSEEEALEEARFVLERIREYEITYPVAFDTEEIKDDESRTDGLSREQFTDNCIAFCDSVEEAGYDSLIYANMKWMAFTLELERLADYDKWYADYESVPQCPYEFSMWQYSESGTVPGVEGSVDLNIDFENN